MTEAELFIEKFENDKQWKEEIEKHHIFYHEEDANEIRNYLISGDKEKANEILREKEWNKLWLSYYCGFFPPKDLLFFDTEIPCCTL